MREVPDAVARAERDPQIGQFELVRLDFLGHAQVAADAAEFDVGSESWRAAHVDLAADDEVAAPAEIRLQAGEERSDREGFDFGLDLGRRRLAAREGAACSSAAPGS
jgi:hypothetical protein